MESRDYHAFQYSKATINAMTVNGAGECWRPLQYYQSTFVFMSPLTCPVNVMVDEMCISEVCAIVLPIHGMRYASRRPASHRCLPVSQKEWQRITKNRTAVRAEKAFALCLVQVPFSFCSLHVTGGCNVKYCCGI